MNFWDRKHTSQSLKALGDESLCREAKKGCYEAYLVLFDRYWRQVFRLVHAVLHDEGEAEVVAQALFLEVHQNMLQFDSEIQKEARSECSCCATLTRGRSIRDAALRVADFIPRYSFRIIFPQTHLRQRSACRRAYRLRKLPA